jgi:hypothetical protein
MMLLALASYAALAWPALLLAVAVNWPRRRRL